MTTPTDNQLTQDGLALENSNGRVLLIACGAIAREVLDLIKTNGWSHIQVTCLPAIWHNHPERIAPGVKAIVEKHRGQFEHIYVLYADCGTSGELLDLCNKLDVEMLKGPHCYSFFEGNEGFAERTQHEFTAFYLTDFLVRQFDTFVWKPLGLDKHPELRDTYFGNYEKLVYQAQTNNPELDEQAKDCAKRLGLKFEKRFTGYGDLENSLQDWLA